MKLRVQTRTATHGEHRAGREFELGIVAGCNEFPKIVVVKQPTRRHKSATTELYELARSSAGLGRSLPQRNLLPVMTTTAYAMPRLDTQ